MTMQYTALTKLSLFCEELLHIGVFIWLMIIMVSLP